MANDLNDCKFIGHAGADPETRYMPNGGNVCNFSIAVGKTWNDKASGNKQERTEWVRCTAFGKLGEICQSYITKGKQVFVSGEMRTDEYEKDGSKRYSTSIILQDMQLLGSRSDGDAGQNTNSKPATQRSQQGAPPASQDFDTDIPFNSLLSYP